MARVRAALVGAGNIAGRYATRILASERLELAGATDAIPGRAEALVAAHGGVAYAGLQDLLADDDVDLVVNLTAPQAHAAVTAAALDAGKHVHSEKPLALQHTEAEKLVELARVHGVRLSASPATLLGEAQQTLWKLVREGAIGRVRAVYAEANWDRIEAWHPDPRELYAVGPMVDVGVYPITILTAMFGPARRVQAFATMLEPDRKLLDGTAFQPGAPDFVVAMLELEEGVLARVTASFYVGAGRQRGLELHGDSGSLWMPAWADANSRVQLQQRRGEYEPVELVREPFPGIDWSRALVDLAEAVEEERSHRASAEHAAHVVEILNAVERAAAAGGSVEVRSTFERPEPMEWAR
jgi:predicted dehydrogenase